MFIRLFLVLVMSFLPVTVSALEVPKLIGRINDHAGLLSQRAVVRFDRRLSEFERATSNQMAVLTIPSLEGDDINPFALRVGNTWRLGQKGKNNGLLIIIAKADRKTRIEVGIGLQDVLTDAEAGEILREVMRPYLKEGLYDRGVEAGIDAIINKTKYKFRTPYWDSYFK